MPASRKGVHYAFLSAPVETRWTASRGAPPPLFGPGLSLGGKPNAESTSSQQTDIRPGTDWTFLMSAPAFRGQKQPPKTPPKLVQRPWSETPSRPPDRPLLVESFTFQPARGPQVQARADGLATAPKPKVPLLHNIPRPNRSGFRATQSSANGDESAARDGRARVRTLLHTNIQ